MGLRGPPPKPGSELRRHPVACRLTDRELARLDAGRPPGASRGEWLRRLALARTLPRPVPEANKTMWSRLSTLASNLNQLARAWNADGIAPDIATTRRLLADIRAALVGLEVGGRDDRED